MWLNNEDLSPYATRFNGSEELATQDNYALRRCEQGNWLYYGVFGNEKMIAYLMAIKKVEKLPWVGLLAIADSVHENLIPFILYNFVTRDGPLLAEDPLQSEARAVWRALISNSNILTFSQFNPITQTRQSTNHCHPWYGTKYILVEHE